MVRFVLVVVSLASIVFGQQNCNGMAVNNQCPTGYTVSAGNLCCTTQKTCAGTPLGQAVGGQCPSGYTVTVGNLCCPNGQVVDGCADKVNPNTGISDCPKMVAYCNNSAYKQLMAEQCPKTCGLCNGTGNACTDEVNANTGTSDCPRMAVYCNNSAYKELLAKQCRKTCGLC